MGRARYVLLGLAHARSPWFRQLAQWANASAIPAEFLKCVSAEEARARLAGGRSFSALIIDASLASLDRDLIETAQQMGCAIIVVDDGRSTRDWVQVRANASLPAAFDQKELLDTLTTHCVMISRADHVVLTPDEHVGGWQASLAAVCGPGGTGASTVAIALAQGLCNDVREAGSVLLADFALNAEQAMLHDAPDVVPGVQELVELFRSGRPSGDEIRSLAFSSEERGYALLLGLRRARAWAAIRPRAFTAALEGLRSSYRTVIADVDADVEGEDEGGSIDVEERHAMSRNTMAAADAVLVVGAPGMKGLHALVRVSSDLLSFGVPPERLLPVINRAPRSGRARAELAAALAGLLPAKDRAAMPSPLFLPERRIDDLLRDTVRLPEGLTTLVANAYLAVATGPSREGRYPLVHQRVRPGSLGHWAPDAFTNPGVAHGCP